jgi:hypothetical protein
LAGLEIFVHPSSGWERETKFKYFRFNRVSRLRALRNSFGFVFAGNPRQQQISFSAEIMGRLPRMRVKPNDLRRTIVPLNRFMMPGLFVQHVGTEAAPALSLSVSGTDVPNIVEPSLHDAADVAGAGTAIKGLMPGEPASVLSSGTAPSPNAAPVTGSGLVGDETVVQPPDGEDSPNGETAAGVPVTPSAAALASASAAAAAAVTPVAGHAVMLPSALRRVGAKLLSMAPNGLVLMAAEGVEFDTLDDSVGIASAPGADCAKHGPVTRAIAIVLRSTRCIDGSCALVHSGLYWRPRKL